MSFSDGKGNSKANTSNSQETTNLVDNSIHIVDAGAISARVTSATMR